MSGSGTSNISFSSSGTLNALHLIASMLYVYMYAPTVATDLPYVYACGAVLRSLI
jgi:hypothetical protein